MVDIFVYVFFFILVLMVVIVVYLKFVEYLYFCCLDRLKKFKFCKGNFSERLME